MDTPAPDARLDGARAGLARLLEQGRPPKILEVLRSLKTEILLNIRHGTTQEEIRRVLNEAGYRISRSGFSYAFHMLRLEEGLVGRNGRARSLPNRTAAPSLMPPPRSPGPAVGEAHSSALAHLSRPSLQQVLGKGL